MRSSCMGGQSQASRFSTPLPTHLLGFRRAPGTDWARWWITQWQGEPQLEPCFLLFIVRCHFIWELVRG